MFPVRFIQIGLLSLLIIIAPAPGATVVNYANLKSDWSNVSNPNAGPFGAWSYTQGGTPLSAISHWAGDGGQTLVGWGPAANAPGDFLPFFFQTTSPYGDSEAGDVLIHTTDGANGDSNGPAVLLWTSNVTGTVNVIGSLWPPRLIGRLNDYQLSLVRDGTPTVLDAGQIVEDGSISRCVPIRFRIPGLTINPGDVLMLQITQNASSPFGDFAGVSLSVSSGNCPNSSGDINGDGRRDGRDIAHFVDCLLNGNSACGDCSCSDMNNDGFTNLDDLPDFVAALL
ncbi:MAG TPA: hypothetical protein VMV81_14445 [Phycisphaerae bacterium]|nr:hypothetical protein [Phycisphaerae bacterium]